MTAFVRQALPYMPVELVIAPVGSVPRTVRLLVGGYDALGRDATWWCGCPTSRS